MDIQETLSNTKIINVDVEKEMKKSFLDYSMSVIVSRALPDVRDGLKPVHRRILYSQYEDKLTPVTCLADITRTVTVPYMMHLFVWLRIFQ